MANEQILSFDFPTRGLNQSHEFDRQPQGTTRRASNVRTFEQGTQRARGGARPGLTRYLNERPGGIDSVIQHLNAFVDPTHEALPTKPELLGPAFDTVILPDDTVYPLPTFLADFPQWVTDQSGEEIIRNGGSGESSSNTRRRLVTITPNNIGKGFGNVYVFAGTEFTASGQDVGDLIQHVTLSSPGTDAAAEPGTYTIRGKNAIGRTSLGERLSTKYRFKYNTGTLTIGNIEFVQNSFSAGEHLAGTEEAPFVSNVTAGNLLVLAMVRSIAGVPVITDTLGNTYTLLATGTAPLYVWYCVSAGSGPNTITATFAPGGHMAMTAMEYSGTHASPLDDIATNQTGTSTLAVNVTGTPGLVIGFFVINSSPFGDSGHKPTMTGPTNFSERGGFGAGVGTQTPALFVFDNTGVAISNDAVGPVVASESVTGNCAISFKKA